MKATTNLETLLSSTAVFPPSAEPTSLPREALSISEAAVSLGVGRDQIYKIIARKELRAVKCGRRTLVPLSALRSYLDGLPPLEIDTGAA
jgi:excisionase family DNA binding protein